MPRVIYKQIRELYFLRIKKEWNKRRIFKLKKYELLIISCLFSFVTWFKFFKHSTFLCSIEQKNSFVLTSCNKWFIIFPRVNNWRNIQIIFPREQDNKFNEFIIIIIIIRIILTCITRETKLIYSFIWTNFRNFTRGIQSINRDGRLRGSIEN